MAKLKTVKTRDEFFSLLGKSRLVSDQELERARRAAAKVDDPIAIARQLVKDGQLTGWQARQLLSGFHGFVFGNYKLCDQIGKGELGRVFLAEHVKLGKQVALKALFQPHTASPELVKRFLAEAEAASALEHRNIIHVHDASSEGDRHYMVMEYVRGRDLQQWVKENGPLSFAETADYVSQAASGLGYAHGRGVLHRDIKPANLLVDDQGVVKILDMGVGQLRGSVQTAKADTGELLLSAIAYMSPEQAREGEVDRRSDIYSLGCTMYFLLTGRTPFAVKSDEERQKIKQTKRPVDVLELRPDTPAELATLCRQMMSPKGDDRPRSMDEVAAVLDGWLKDNRPAEKKADAVAAKGDESAEKAGDVKGPKDKPALGKKIIIDTSGEGLPGGKSVETIPTDFSIQTKRKKKPKRKPATKEPAAAQEPAATDKPVSPKPAKKPIPLGLVIGGAAAASLLLVLGAVVVVVLLSGRKSPEVAQSAADKQTEGHDVDPEMSPKADPEMDVENVPDRIEVVAASPGAGNAESSGDTPAVPGKAADSRTEDDPPAAPSDRKKPDEPAPEVPAPSEPAAPAKPAMAEEAAEAPSQATDAPAAGATTEKGQPMPAPDTAEKPAPETEKPAPAEADKKDATETKEKAAPKEQPEKPPPKTFVMASAIDLPTFSSGEGTGSLLLGKVDIGPQDTCFISMYGGERAMRGRNKFSLRNARSGTAPRDWEFVWTDPAGEETIIATLALPEKELTFQWTGEAASAATADHLRNCSLKITAGQSEPHEITLRTPKAEPPLTIELGKPLMAAKWDIDALPDPDAIRIDASLEGHKFALDPPAAMPAGRGEQWIYVGENKDQAVLLFKMETSLKGRGLQVRIEPYFKVPTERQPLLLNKANLKRYANIGMARPQLDAMVKKLEKVPPEQRTRVQNLLADARLKLQAIDETTQRMQQMEKLQESLSGVAKLHLRVYYDTLDKQIDLLVTDASAPASNAK